MIELSGTLVMISMAGDNPHKQRPVVAFRGMAGDWFYEIRCAGELAIVVLAKKDTPE